MGLADYDLIVISTSGGKDSQAMLAYVHGLARAAGVEGRVVCVHADLGGVEWEGTGEIAGAQAKHFGVPLVTCSRIGGVAARTSKTYEAGEVYGDILDYALRRGAFPSSSARWCTSEFKRGPIRRTITALAGRARAERGIPTGTPVRVLSCVGMRAEESSARAKLEAVSVERDTRHVHVTRWLPIKDWTTEEVWRAIEASGAPVHRAYGLGMSRLSCAFCIMASRGDLKIAARHNPELFARYTSVERETGHLWRPGTSLVEYIEGPQPPREEGGEGD